MSGGGKPVVKGHGAPSVANRSPKALPLKILGHGLMSEMVILQQLPTEEPSYNPPINAMTLWPDATP